MNTINVIDAKLKYYRYFQEISLFQTYSVSISELTSFIYNTMITISY